MKNIYIFHLVFQKKIINHNNFNTLPRIIVNAQAPACDILHFIKIWDVESKYCNGLEIRKNGSFV